MKRFLIALFALLVASLAVAVVSAQEPVLSGGLTDQAGVIRDRGAVEAALARLEAAGQRVQLHALFVNTTGGQAMSAYTDAVVRRNNLGASDSLLVVAVADRTYQLWLGDGVADVVDEDEHENILQQVESELRSGDYDGAVIAAADGVRSRIGGSSGDGGGGGGFSWWPILVIVGVALGGFLIYRLVQDSRRSGRQTAADRKQLQELATRANALLVETDESLRDADQEVAFARAEFSDDEVAPFAAALEQARSLLRQAFAHRQQLEDQAPDAAARAKGLEEIVRLGEEAAASIKATAQGISEMRALERNVATVLPQAEAELARLRDDMPEAREAFAGLTRHAQAVWRAVKNNLIEAEKDTSAAAERLRQARTSLEARDSRSAASGVRFAQQATARGRTLLTAIIDLAGRLQDAERRTGPELAAAEADLSAARAAVRDYPGQAARVAEAEASLASARKAATASPPDYVTALDLALKANVTADEVLADVRGEVERKQRERELAQTSIRNAESSIRKSADYLQNRSWQIDVQARTRLTEAERRLDNARRHLEDDPRGATEEAQAASRLAEEALSYSMRDSGEMPGRGGLNDLGSIILGGILMGRGGGGFGRSGSSGWGGGFGRGGGRSMGGGFGGSSGRSRGGRW